MTVQTQLNYAQIQAYGLPVFRVVLNNWGNRGTGKDAASLVYPVANQDAIQSAAAIAIGPDSTADRVVANFNALLRPFTAALNNPDRFDVNIDQIVSVDRPALSPMAGPINLRASTFNFYGDAYFRDNDPNPHNFGGLEPLFESPVLELDFYLRPPPVGIPTKRNPMFRVFQQAVVNTNENLLGIWPVFGRKCMTVYFAATGDIVAGFRVGLISYSNQNGSFPPTIISNEVTMGSGGVSAVTGQQGEVSVSTPGQYLAAYYTKTSGTGGFVQGHMLATDDCCAQAVINPPPPGPS